MDVAKEKVNESGCGQRKCDRPVNRWPIVVDFPTNHCVLLSSF